MNMAVESYTSMGSEKALKYMETRKMADFNPIEVSCGSTYEADNSGQLRRRRRLNEDSKYTEV
jgi:hypothetical protein